MNISYIHYIEVAKYKIILFYEHIPYSLYELCAYAYITIRNIVTKNYIYCATINKFSLCKIYTNMLRVKYIWRKLQDITEGQKRKLEWMVKHYWMKRLNTA